MIRSDPFANRPWRMTLCAIGIVAVPVYCSACLIVDIACITADALDSIRLKFSKK